MKALIAAGGRGTRLRPITYSLNKHLIPVANKAMIIYAIEKVVEAGITDIAINVNEGEQDIQRVVGDGSTWGARITYIEQIGGALGVAHIIKMAQSWLGDDSFVFYLGDNIVLGSIKPLVEHFQESGANAYLALSKVDDPGRFGVPVINADGEITEVIEKPEHPPTDYAVTGVYCYDKTVHEAINELKPSPRGEYEISDTHTLMIKKGGVIKYDVVEGWWKDTGKPDDLLEGNRLLMDLLKEKNAASLVEETVQISGLVDIAEGVQLKGNTVIQGPVCILENTVVEDSVVGPYVAVGASTSIKNTTIDNCIVMDNAVIHSNNKKIADSIIGHNAHIERETEPSVHRMMLGENSYLEL